MMVTAQGWSDFGRRLAISLAVALTETTFVLYSVFMGAVQPMF